MRSMRFLYVVAAVCLCVTGGGADGSWDCGKTVVPTDSSPGAMDVKLSVEEGGEEKDGTALVSMLFNVSDGIAQFQAGETVTCNGLPLMYVPLLGYSAWVPTRAPGGAYEFVYTRQGTPTKVSMKALDRPLVTSPMRGAMLQRSNHLSITYMAAGGNDVRAEAGDGKTFTLGSSQPDTGTYTGLDVTQLKAGPGTLGLVRVVDSALQNTGFKSVETSYQVSSSMAVTWL